MVASLLLERQLSSATITRAMAKQVMQGREKDFKGLVYGDGEMSDESWQGVRARMAYMEAHKWEVLATREAGIAMLAAAGIAVTFSGQDKWPDNPCCALWKDGVKRIGCSDSKWLSHPVSVMRKILEMEHGRGYASGEESARKKMRAALGI